MEKKMELTRIIKGTYGLYRDYRVYIGVILGQWRGKWKLLFRV